MRNGNRFIRFGKQSLDLIPTSNITPPASKRFPGSQGKKMKYAATLILALSASLAIICMSGCGNGYSLEDVKKTTDQDLLAMIAMEAGDRNVRLAAVEKMTDQAALARVALEAEDGVVRRSAVLKLTDQEMLATVAIRESDSRVYRAALEKLTDQALLAKFALEIKVIRAFDSVPNEHRARLKDDLMPVFRALSDPAVVSEIGEIVSITTDWESTIANYIGGTMYGERFTCSIRVGNMAESLSHTWSTVFPSSTTRLGFKSAPVSARDLLVSAFDQLSQPALAKFVIEDEDSDVRQAAVRNLTDQSLLAKIAREDEDEYVRRAAQLSLEAFREGGQ